MNLVSRVWVSPFAQIDLKKAVLSILDGSSPTPNEIDVKVGEGTLTYTERVEREYTLDRGTLDLVRDGDEVPMEVRFDLTWEYITAQITSSGSPPTVEDALKNRLQASAWVSSDTDLCNPYAVDQGAVLPLGCLNTTPKVASNADCSDLAASDVVTSCGDCTAIPTGDGRFMAGPVCLTIKAK